MGLSWLGFVCLLLINQLPLVYYLFLHVKLELESFYWIEFAEELVWCYECFIFHLDGSQLSRFLDEIDEWIYLPCIFHLW